LGLPLHLVSSLLHLVGLAVLAADVLGSSCVGAGGVGTSGSVGGSSGNGSAVDLLGGSVVSGISGVDVAGCGTDWGVVGGGGWIGRGLLV
jgi:hypothetical protein